MSKRYGWMMWGGSTAHGPFESVTQAFDDAVDYLGLGPKEKAEITINEIFKPDFLNYIPDADDLAVQASEQFDDAHGFSDEGWMFERVGNREEADNALQEALRSWAEKWISTMSNWFIEEGEKTIIVGSGKHMLETDEEKNSSDE